MPAPVLLDNLIELFFQKDFSFEDAAKIIGPVQTESEFLVTLQAKPRTNVSLAKLEKLFMKPESPAYMSGVRIDFIQPVDVSFKDLAKKYGVAEELPGHDPEDVELESETMTYQYMIIDGDYPGYLLLETPDFSKSAIRWVRGFILRRFPAELWKHASLIPAPAHVVQAAAPQE